MVGRITSAAKCACLLASCLGLCKGDDKADPRAAEVFEQFCRTAGGTKAVRVSFLQRMGVASQDTGQQSYTLNLARPSRILLLPQEGSLAATKVISDGKSVLAYSTMRNPVRKYTLEPVGQRFQEALTKDKIGKQAAGVQAIPGLDILLSAMDGDCAGARTKFTSMRYLGNRKRNELDCEAIEVSDAERRLELWFTTGPERLLLYVRSTFDKDPAIVGKDGPMTAVTEFFDWKLNPDLPSDLFSVQPPVGAEQEKLPLKP